MAIKFKNGFFAYPSGSLELVATIENASASASTIDSGKQITIWPQLSNVGVHIADSVRKKIDVADFLIGDITLRNNNVYYEVGYAIGKGKPILPALNGSFKDSTRSIQSDGFFDNIKYEIYDNANDLIGILTKFSGHSLLEAYQRDINHEQPLFFLDSFKKTDFRNSIVSAIKSSKVFYRSFDPTETPRFSTSNIIAAASSSGGAIVPFLSESIVDSERHNLRASFLAGILHGLGRKVLLIQHGESPVAADYREEIEIVRNPDQIVEIIEDFARQSILATQTISRSSKSLKRKGIAKLTLGASAAENEFRRLEDYFLETAEFNQTIRGDGKIVAGRKGSGKTAIFFRARDIFRNDSRNIVIDLKPESHELIKLRELLSEYKNLGIVSHTFTGFWQVIFLHEILLKVKSDLEYKSRRDHTALGEIIEIDKTIGDIISSPRGDFTERLNYFVNSMLHKLESSAKEYGGKIPPEKITNFVYDNNMRLMYDLSKKHLKKYNCAVLFFDNIDKGWPATGIHQNDILIVRCLIDAANKIQREYAHADIDFRFSVFLRNDVYELLVENTSDRGKDAQIKIDWSDPEKLKLLIGRRLSDALNTDDSVKQIWDTYFPKSVEGEDGFDYAIRHSLMRPRFLIDILERSISIAVNRGKQVVEIEDLREAILQHSRYLVNDFGYEIRDVSGITYEILDAFLGSRKILSADEVRNRLSSYVEPEIIDDAIKHLVWYGFLGFMKDGNEKYIYDYNYIMRRMHSEINRAGSKTDYVINPAFYIGLQ